MCEKLVEKCKMLKITNSASLMTFTKNINQNF